MPINILMPALSPTMEEGTLAKWLVKEGDKVASGAILAEIETDKATMEFEAVDEGTVGKIVVPEGTEGVKVNDLIAVLLEEGESADAHRRRAAPSRRRRPQRPATEPRPRQPARGAAAARRRRAGDGGRPRLRVAARAADRGREGPRPRRGQGLRPERPHRQGRRRSRASPARPARPPAPAAAKPRRLAAAPRRRPRRRGGQEALRRPRVRGDQARRHAQDDRRAAHRGQADDPALLPAARIRLDALLAFRSQLNKELESRGVKLSVNDFIIKACASRCSRCRTATPSGPAIASCG